MRFLLALSLFITTPAMAQTICDFEHHCYPDGGVSPHALPAPRAPPVLAPAPANPPGKICHLMELRESPSLPVRVVELCSMPEAVEQMLRDRLQSLYLRDSLR